MDSAWPPRVCVVPSWQRFSGIYAPPGSPPVQKRICLVGNSKLLLYGWDLSMGLFRKDLPEPHTPLQNFSAQTELQDCRCTPYNPPSLIVYRIRKIEQQLDNLTRCSVLTKHLLFLLGGEKQTAINWECTINSYGNKVSKYLIIAYVCKCLLTRFA